MLSKYLSKKTNQTIFDLFAYHIHWFLPSLSTTSGNMSIVYAWQNLGSGFCCSSNGILTEKWWFQRCCEHSAFWLISFGILSQLRNLHIFKIEITIVIFFGFDSLFYFTAAYLAFIKIIINIFVGFSIKHHQFFQGYFHQDSNRNQMWIVVRLFKHVFHLN